MLNFSFWGKRLVYIGLLFYALALHASSICLASDATKIRINGQIPETIDASFINNFNGGTASIRYAKVVNSGAELIIYRSTDPMDCIDDSCLTMIIYGNKENKSSIILYSSETVIVFYESLKFNSNFRSHVIIEPVYENRKSRLIIILYNDRLIVLERQ